MLAIHQASRYRISEADRRAINSITHKKLGPAISAAYDAREADALEKLKAAGYQIDVMDSTSVEKFRAAIKPLEDEWIERSKAVGVTDPASILAELRAAVAKEEASAR